MTISILAQDRNSAIESIENAFEEFSLVERLASHTDARSELTQIGNLEPGQKLRISSILFELLLHCRQLWSESGGLFDVVVPMPNSTATYADVVLEFNSVSLRKKLTLNLGGIAKGFAVDRAFKSLRHARCNEVTVNAGGDLRVHSKAPRPILVRDPRNLNNLVTIGEGYDFACATSADYYRKESPALQSDFALYDPSRRKTVVRDSSISVVADRCMDADAFTKIATLSLNRGDTKAQVAQWLQKRGAEMFELNDIPEVASDSIVLYAPN